MEGRDKRLAGGRRFRGTQFGQVSATLPGVPKEGYLFFLGGKYFLFI
jgi:hypothetical protein